ncbi:unnamed protein product [Auanema sp. JU1783]|nr:unnamed protein product [Auanema sp. JU1783]
MNDPIHCILLNHTTGSNPEQEISEKLKEILEERNTKGIQVAEALQELGIANIKECVIGPNHVAILCEDGGVRRIGFQSRVQHVLPSSTTTSIAPVAVPSASSTQSSAACAVRNAAKFRRVMLSGLRRGERAGVIIDRGRPLIPASSVPEELIAQAQVVLQGKSREVIVRELQRTSLNVNEAVNNLLSRDDDDEDGEDNTNEVVLPEELLSLLDPSSHNLLEASDLYSDFDYVHLRDASRKSREKDRKTKDSNPLPSPATTNREELNSVIQTWNQDGTAMPAPVERFIKIVATKREVVALSACGKIYSWEWSSRFGDETPNIVASRLLGKEITTTIASSVLRIAAITNDGKIATWLTHTAVGHRASRATEIKTLKLPLSEDENIVELCVSDLLVVVRTSKAFHWCGLYPFNDRPKIWEKERAKSRKHVTFDTTSSEIEEGCEVRTKSCPIYAAGSVALNISGDKATIGVLMESVWTLTEICRFRVFEPFYYDNDTGDMVKPEGTSSIPAPGESRKRRASSEIFSSNPIPREEPWSVSDVIWIHEQSANDCAVVKITDGAYCGIEYSTQSGDSQYASSLSSSLHAKEQVEKIPGKIRLMRKDDLCIVTPKMKSSHSPRNLQKEPIRFTISGNTYRRVLSAVADTSGIRCLVEKRGKLYITRVSVCGKILSEHFLPIHAQSIYGSNGALPKLLNYGVDFILFLMDGNGSIIPLARNAARGFKEPVVLNLPPIVKSSLCVCLNDMSIGVGISKTWSKKVSLVLLSSPSVSALQAQLSSLLQTILYCDAEGVKCILDRMYELKDKDLIDAEALNVRSDGGANIIHSAIRLTLAKKNKEDIDSGTVHGIRLREEETRMAREEAKDLDQKWQRLIRQSRVENSNKEVDQSLTQQVPPSRNPELNDVPMVELEQEKGVVKPVSGVKERQKGALDVVKVLLDHPVLKPIIVQLLSHRDFNGLTPFQAALNSRAFGAAALIWDVIDKTPKDELTSTRMIYPSGSRPDDSPLFLLCYNDTCSFSWTGEEHINQDIFECRTCGLTGSLCCCTECAFTCHRNHDCKLKKTSPTAYCDCWEKCACKALVAGNQEKREYLLRELLRKTKLHESTNNRGEHVVLFLARTYGRQQSEQSHFSRRKPATTSSGDTANTPEHDLDPPRFAKYALDVCLGEWNVLTSLISIGMRVMPREYIMEDTIGLMSQHGCSHLDKFTFVLFSRCADESGKLIVDSMVSAAGNARDSKNNVEEIISRFARSLVRLFTLCVLVSPTAASVAVRGMIDPGPVSTNDKRGSNLQSLGISGFFSLMKHDYKSHEPKNQAIISFVCRIRSALQNLAPFSLCQAAYAADAILVPVRMGILKPSILAGLSPSQDPMEVIEKFLNSESDLTSHLSRPEENKEKISKRRKTSRRTSEKGSSEQRKEESDGDSDSDDDGQSSRRHNSQSGMEESILDISAGTAEPLVPRRKNGISEAMPEEETDETSSESDSEDEEGHVLIGIDDNLDDEETDEATEQAYETSSPRNEQETNTTFSIRDPDNDENEEETPGEGDEESARNENSNVVVSAPTAAEVPESADEPPEDQDNTRDVLLSETSSAAEQPDTREEGGTRLRRYRIGAGGPSPRALMRRQTQFATTNNLEWTRRTFPLEDDFENGIENRIKGENRNKKKNDEPHPTTLLTGVQLSTVFSFLVRLVSDFIDCVNDPYAEKSMSLLHIPKEAVDDMLERVEQLFEPCWSWLSVSMDRMESQLFFGNAILQNSSGEIKPKINKRKEPVKKEKVVVAEDPSTAALRRETLSYIIGTIRAQSREAGDDFPTIESENVRMLVFVLEAYIIFQDAIEKYRSSQKFAHIVGHPSLNYLSVQKFYKRSDSLCFPGGLNSGAWDTLDSRTSYIPLAEKPYLLVPENEKESLFGPSRGLTNFDTFKQNTQALGSRFILNMSLSEPLYDFPYFESGSREGRIGSIGVQNDLRSVESLRSCLKSAMTTPLNKALSRWKHVMVFMAKECHQLLLDSYGGDPGDSPLLLHVASFSVKQKMFRSTLEKCRNSQSKDIVIDVNREPLQLIRGTVYQLNKVYVRRSVMFKGRDNTRTTLGYPRVKVRFQDEPGEGSGVARSFYTALAEALQTSKVFPFEDFGWEGEDYLFGNPEESPAPTSNTNHPTRERSTRLSAPRNSPANTTRPLSKDIKIHPMSLTSPPYVVQDTSKVEPRISNNVFRIDQEDAKKSPRDVDFLCEYIFCRVNEIKPSASGRITGMILDIPMSGVVQIINNMDCLHNYIDEALTLLQQSTAPSDLELLGSPDTSQTDNFPLFVRSSKTSSFVIPFPGNLSPMRLNAFRNVGRVMGLCLAQGELFPIKLCRHIFKFILDRPIGWLDLQFYDLQLFNSLRQVLLSREEDFDPLSLRFLDEATDGISIKTTPLKLNGEDIPVTKDNVVEYVHRLISSRLSGPDNLKCLNAIKQGVHDVLPVEALRVLNAEDMRLMICGSDTICITTLQYRTSFSDESHSSSDTIDKFKDWFWSVFESLSNQEKQDLLFFWTGAPSLPPSSLYPYPTVMIRPPDDLYLPTANTCISRLYVPLYSTRKILKNKLLLAIKAKNFGFV